MLGMKILKSLLCLALLLAASLMMGCAQDSKPVSSESANAKQADSAVNDDAYSQAFEAYYEREYRLAIKKLTPFAEQDDPKAQYHLALIHYYGNPSEDLPINIARAADWLYRGAQANYPPALNLDIWDGLAAQGSVLANYFYGTVYYDEKTIDPKTGDIIAPNYQTALPYFKAASTLGDRRAQHYLGFMYFYGQGAQKNYRKARKEFVKSITIKDSDSEENFDQAELNARARYYLGLIYLRGYGTNKDIDKAFAFFKLSAEGGDARAQYYLAGLYYTGEAGVKNADLAFQYAKLSAAQKHAPAQYLLGLLYYHGIGTLPNYQKAVKSYEEAIDQEHFFAKINLGKMYQMGQGVHQNSDLALGYFVEAAYANNSDAQFQMGMMYYFGEIVEPDNVEMLTWFHLAANQNHVLAQYNLGVIYRYATGIQADYVVALNWFLLAREQGYKRADHQIDVLQSRMSEVQIDRAYAMKESWKRDNFADASWKNFTGGIEE